MYEAVALEAHQRVCRACPVSEGAHDLLDRPEAGRLRVEQHRQQDSVVEIVSFPHTNRDITVSPRRATVSLRHPENNLSLGVQTPPRVGSRVGVAYSDEPTINRISRQSSAAAVLAQS
jgi:hypothetical protein